MRRVEAAARVAEVGDVQFGVVRLCGVLGNEGDYMQQECLLDAATGFVRFRIRPRPHLRIAVGVLGAAEEPAAKAVGGGLIQMPVQRVGVSLDRKKRGDMVIRTSLGLSRRLCTSQSRCCS